MIAYFANRKMEILGQATTNLPKGFVIIDDLKSEDVDSGVSSFECTIGFDKNNRLQLEEMTEAGNYILRSDGEENEFYTIIESEIDTKNQSIYVYAEDAGLDLINEIVGEYEATEVHTAEWYINKFIKDSGFEIGINEVSEYAEKKLSWSDESTVTERIASIASKFGGFEVSYSFEIKGMEVAKKIINIYESRGKDIGIQLHLNRDVDRIVTKKSVANLATALKCIGATPDDKDKPITLKGYKYDDEEDFYVDDEGILCSRTAVEKWGRYVWNNEPNQLTGYKGHIVKIFNYDTKNQATLCSQGITELKKAREMEVNYEIDINKLPDNVQIGDRVYIVDDLGELYLSTRILKLETSITGETQKATLGEHLIKTSGISQKVADLAEQFAKNAQSAERALSIAETAKTNAENAQTLANEAAQQVATATTKADEAKAASDALVGTVAEVENQVNATKASVEEVKTNVSGLEASIRNAEQAARQAEQAAITAEEKATLAETSASNAATEAEEAKQASMQAQSTAETAISNANAVHGLAQQAEAIATNAQEVAAGAKADAEQALKDIDEFAEGLESVQQTMQADYARKTDLTEATSNLQTQISQNANEIELTANQLTTINETTNNAIDLAEQAQQVADEAKALADVAKEQADQAQAEADVAWQAANEAQAEADVAKEASDTAQDLATQAALDLQQAQENLASIRENADSTQEDINAAELAVSDAQAVLTTAQAEADRTLAIATNAQQVADEALGVATQAQIVADKAKAESDTAQALASQTNGAAVAADVAMTASLVASMAQSQADKAQAQAILAQARADEALTNATNAQNTLNQAQADMEQAQVDLEQAQTTLDEVLSKVDATEEEVEAAQANVILAQKYADKATANAEIAQAKADQAQADAEEARQAADKAEEEAEKALVAANKAQEVVDKAKADVDNLAVRVTSAETKIIQNADQIKLKASKEEVAETLGGYYTKKETDAALTVESGKITSSVSQTYSTKEDIENDVKSRLEKAESLIQQLSDSISMLVTSETQYYLVDYNETTGEYTVTDTQIESLDGSVVEDVTTTDNQQVYKGTTSEETEVYYVIKSGSSLMTQTSSGWTFSMEQVLNTLDSATENIDTLSKDVGTLDGTIDVLNSALGDLENLSSYVRIVDVNGQPCIELGSYNTETNEQSEFKVQITNTDIRFMEGSSIPTWINNQALNISKAVVEDELVFGGFAWKKRDNGNVGLVWKGVDS